MDDRILFFIIGLIGLLFYFLGRYRVINQSTAAKKRPHSLVHYYGLYPFFLATIPSVFIVALMQTADGIVLSSMIAAWRAPKRDAS